jgi:carbonic anhydrase
MTSAITCCDSGRAGVMLTECYAFVDQMVTDKHKIEIVQRSAGVVSGGDADVKTTTNEQLCPPVAPSGGPVITEVYKFIAQVITDNAQHVKETEVLQSCLHVAPQKPVATVLMCSDSRVLPTAFHRTHNVAELFMVRNIGNQVETAAGSLEFGVRRLHTPVLFIVGHSDCGAIRAGMSDFSGETESIQRELASLDVAHADSLEQGISFNIHHQVDDAMRKFHDLITTGDLTVIGAVYDFKNDFHRGYGVMAIVNINGERDKDAIKRITEKALAQQQAVADDK